MTPRDRIPTLEHELAPRSIRDALGISRERMARLLDVSTRTIERWEDRTELPAGSVSRSHLAKLQEIVDLGLIVYGSDTFRKYVSLPMPVFGGRTALQLIEQGEADRVYGALAADYEGQGF
jgi:transcriptional regulator with XRE-family HTH domain